MFNKIRYLCLIVLNFSLFNTILKAQTWSSAVDYFAWYGDDGLGTTTANSFVVGGLSTTVTATSMSGGTGIVSTAVSESGASIFKVQNINSNSFALAATNNDYIKATIFVPAAHDKIRLKSTRVNGVSTTSGGSYFWSMVVVDLATNIQTTLFQDISIGTTGGFSQSSFTPYEMLANKSYEVRWYMHTGSISNTTRAIDNPVLTFQDLVCGAGTSAPSLSSNAKSNICPSTTVDISTITASNTPSLTTLTWHSGTPATTANKLSSITALGAGTYYAAFYDAVYGCYSGVSGNGSATTSVTVTILSCCNAGSSAPILSTTTRSNVCPVTTANLTTITASNTPIGTTLTWHTATPATNANKMTTLQAQLAAAGTYYAAFHDATNGCYSNSGNGTTIVTVTINSCFSLGNAPFKSTYVGQITTGNAAIELLPTLGTAPYSYTNDTGNGTCTPIGGAMALTGLTVTSATGAYTYTAPAVSGIYYYCIRVCDNATPTPTCATRTYNLTVLAFCTTLSQTLSKQ